VGSLEPKPPRFFTFPEDARRNTDRQAVEFGVEIGEYSAWSGGRSECSRGSCPSGPPPSLNSQVDLHAHISCH
jgi:hypothetical protein